MSLHLRTSTATIIVLALVMPAAPTALAEGSVTLLIVPHCTEKTNCPEYAVADADHLTTAQLTTGDVLDIDILVRGVGSKSVREVKSWLTYDKKILEARSVELLPALPNPTPGEQNIDASAGIVKIGGSTTSGFSSSDTRIARVTFRVLETSANTEIRFEGYNPGGNGKTAVNGEGGASSLDEGTLPAPPCIDKIFGCGETKTPLLATEPAKLTVKLSSDSVGSNLTGQVATGSQAGNTQTGSTASIAPQSGTMQSSVSQSSGASSSESNNTFGTLQVQDVRVTTKDTVIFLGWQELRSSQLAGYNVYYGTVSGRYIQRRSLPITSTSLVLRDLQPGTTYFLAVRAVNKQEQESVFSQEVSVTVGKPETSTAPMTQLPKDSGAIGGNPIEKRGGQTINGETGSASVLILTMLFSALIGTGFAFRRQLTISQ